MIRLCFDKAHTHQPTQRIEGMRPAAEQCCLGRNRVDAPVVGGALVDDIVVVVQVFAFAIEQRSQIPRPQEPMDVVQTGGVAHLIAHLVGQPRAFRQGNDALTFVDGQRHRDFAQHMLAGSQCHDGVLSVQMIRGGDDDGINSAVGQHCLDVCVDRGDLVPLGSLGSQLCVDVAHGDHPTVRQHLERLQM